jgi:hypothetical protein
MRQPVRDVASVILAATVATAVLIVTSGDPAASRGLHDVVSVAHFVWRVLWTMLRCVA